MSGVARVIGALYAQAARVHRIAPDPPGDLLEGVLASLTYLPESPGRRGVTFLMGGRRDESPAPSNAAVTPTGLEAGFVASKADRTHYRSPSRGRQTGAAG